MKEPVAVGSAKKSGKDLQKISLGGKRMGGGSGPKQKERDKEIEKGKTPE